MPIAIIDDPAAVQLIGQRMFDRSHWFVFQCSDDSNLLAQLIEKKYYSKPNTAKLFDLVMFANPDFGSVGICMADKRSMSREQLASTLKIRVEDVGDRDFLLTPDMPVAVIKWIDSTFDAWINKHTHN